MASSPVSRRGTTETNRELIYLNKRLSEFDNRRLHLSLPTTHRQPQPPPRFFYCRCPNPTLLNPFIWLYIISQVHLLLGGRLTT